MLPAEIVVPRLVFVRHLYNLGFQQVVGTFPAASILCFHDSIETFLQIGIEHHQATIRAKTDFLELFKALKEKVADLEGKNALTKLNDARIMVKHKALELSKAEAERCWSRSQSFFEENCPKVFGVEFFSFSISAAICDEHVRNKIQMAEQALGEGKLPESLAEAAKAFDTLKKSHEVFSRSRVSSKSNQSAAEVMAVLIELEFKVNFITIGMPYARYQKFTQLAPSVSTSVSGRQRVAFRRSNITAEQAHFCIDFVVDVVLAVEQYERQLAR